MRVSIESDDWHCGSTAGKHPLRGQAPVCPYALIALPALSCQWAHRLHRRRRWRRSSWRRGRTGVFACDDGRRMIIGCIVCIEGSINAFDDMHCDYRGGRAQGRPLRIDFALYVVMSMAASYHCRHGRQRLSLRRGESVYSPAMMIVAHRCRHCDLTLIKVLRQHLEQPAHLHSHAFGIRA